MGDKSPNIVNEIVVAHTSHAEAVRRMEQSLNDWAADSENKALAILGESGVGKTFALRCILSKYRSHETPEGREGPIVYATIPAKPTIKTLVANLLAGLGDPTWERGTVTQMSKRLRILMRETRTRMVALNEFQHFDPERDRLVHHVTDELKVLIEDTRSILVVAGLPSSMAIIDSNEQLRSRFQSPIVLSRFWWQDIALRREFRAILKAFHSRISEQYEIPELHTEEMAFRFYCATGGLIRHLADILRQAVDNSNQREQKVISMPDLDVAHTQAVWQSTSGGQKPIHPFRRTFIPQESVELLDSAAQIGVPLKHSTAAVAKRSRKTHTRSLHDTLVAR